jgi:hypothetical protein
VTVDDEGIPNGGMEGASASGTYTNWPVTGWQLMFLSEGYGDKSEPCTTTGFCNSGTITLRWGVNASDPFDNTTGLFAPSNPDPINPNNAFAVLATQDIQNDFGDRAYVMKGAVKIPVSVPTTGRPIFMFDWAFATAELNSGPAFNDVARIVLRSAGHSDVTLLEVSRNDLQPGGSGTAFTGIVRKNGDGSPRSCGTVFLDFEAEYTLCTDWQRAAIDMTPYLGYQGTLLVSVEETPYAVDGNGIAFEAEPRPSAFALDNMRLSSATALLVEGVAGPVVLTFPPLTAPYDQVIGYTFNVPGCIAVGGLTNTAQVTCPDNGNYPFSISRFSTGSTVCLNYDFSTQTCINDDYEDDEFKTFGLIQASNVAPTATFVAPASANGAFQLALTNPQDAAGDVAAGFTHAFDCGSGTFTAPASASSYTCPAEAAGTRTVRGRIADKDGGATTYTATVQADRLITSITVPLQPVREEAEVTVTTTFNAVAGESYSATINWGDGGQKTHRASVASGFKAKHAYGLPGLYTVTVTLTGSAGSSDTQSATDYIIVYDPTGGFTSGTGWIQSPVGAYSADPSATGRADFAFSARYPAGATLPTGSMEFTFTVGSLTFTSSAFEWLVIPAPGKAKIEGVGQANGGQGYRFMLTAVDANNVSGINTDRFRVKIWNIATGAVLYDNQRFDDGSSRPDDGFAGSPLRGGDIIVRKR